MHLLYIDEEVKEVLTPKAMVSFRSTTELSNCLDSAKFCSVERKVGSFKCKGHRYVWVWVRLFPLLEVTKEEYKFNDCFNCDEKCLIYPLY